MFHSKTEVKTQFHLDIHNHWLTSGWVNSMHIQVKYANSNHGTYSQLYVSKVTCIQLGL